MQQVFGQIIGQQQEQVIHHLTVLWQKSGGEQSSSFTSSDAKILLSVNLKGLHSVLVFMS